MRLVKEEFQSIDELLKIINARPNNKAMEDQHYSTKSSGGYDKEWSGTDTWEEAVELFHNGDKEKYALIKKELIKMNNAKNVAILPRRQIKTGVVGYAPNVPNALLGLPNSMIYTEKVPMKRKAIFLVALIADNCMTSGNSLVKAGVAVLNVINSLELNGYRVELKLMFFNAVSGDEKAQVTVKLKSYNEHLDLLKLSFPLANPAMFRRFGFKWLETVPDLRERHFSSAYGCTVQNAIIDDKNATFLSFSTIRSMNYDAEKIIKKYFKNL